MFIQQPTPQPKHKPPIQCASWLWLPHVACISCSGLETAACSSTPPALGPGCRYGTWPTSVPTSWNNQLLRDSPAPGMLQARAASASGPSPSGFCAAVAAPPPPPPPPSPQVLAWARQEVGCLVDYDMCTMVGSQGCACSSAPPPADAWRPTALDTDSWIAAGLAAGCRYFILTAKHVCGFLTWNSTSVPQYEYSAAYSATPVDAVAAFVASARAAGAPYGFYYSVNDNARANVCGGRVQPNPQPGQVALTQAEYDAMVLTHLQELWGGYGPLFEVWFDGGISETLTPLVAALFQRLQPDVVAFQGEAVMPRPTRWIGTEHGYAPYPTWSTCDAGSYGAGSPNSTFWFPAETDFTVLAGDTWFFDAAQPVRAAAELRAMYEASVGHNSNALIGLAVPPNGSMAGTQQEAALAGLGAYVAACYGTPIVSAANVSGARPVTLSPSAPVTVGRVVVAEDQAHGQLVRGFTVTALLANGSTVTLDAGPAVGNKKIGVVRPAVVGVVSATLNITAAVAAPDGAGPAVWLFALYGDCDSL